MDTSNPSTTPALIALVPKVSSKLAAPGQRAIEALEIARKTIADEVALGRDPKVVVCIASPFTKDEVEHVCSWIVRDENTNAFEAEGVVQLCIRDYWG